MPNGIIQCPSEDGVHAEIFFTGFNQVKYTDWRYAETKNVLRIVPTYLNNKTVLICEGSSFVVAGGFRWSLKFSDGNIYDSDNFSNGMNA
jgi:hypothetical protein